MPKKKTARQRAAKAAVRESAHRQERRDAEHAEMHRFLESIAPEPMTLEQRLAQHTEGGNSERGDQFVLDFDDDAATAFGQFGDGTDTDDPSLGWPTGLWVDPDAFDVTAEETDELDQWRRNRDHLELYRRLVKLGRKWGEENEAFTGDEWDGFDARETELRTLHEEYLGRGHTGVIVPGTGKAEETH